MNRQRTPEAGKGARLNLPAPLAPRKAGPVILSPSMDAAQAFAEIARACTQQLAANAPGALTSDGVEYIHQMRVALRRLRSALRLFKDWLPVGFVERVGPELKWLGTLLGNVRDYDVLLGATLPELLRTGKQSRAGAHEKRVAAAVAPRHDAAAAKMQRALRSRRYAALLNDLADTCLRVQQAAKPGVGKGKDLRDFAAGKLKRAQRKLRADPDDLLEMTPDERHQLRIAAKRLRYATDFFSSLFANGPTRRYTERLAALQDALGKLNDQAVALQLTDKLAISPRTQAAIRRGLQKQGEILLRDAVQAHKLLMGSKPFWQGK
jgi:CHAD domain-containing protein